MKHKINTDFKNKVIILHLKNTRSHNFKQCDIGVSKNT